MECLTASPLALSLCILLILSAVGIVDGQHRVDEVQALTSFKKELDTSYNLDYDVGQSVGPNYWFTWHETDANACEWVGVICTTNYTVAELDLSGWSLPSLSSVEVLSRLPDLLVLDMSGCGLQVFPEGFGSLTHLTRLDLSNNYLGSMPQSISACRSLKYLSLEHSGIASEIPDLSELVNLQFVLLARNSLLGPFPKELAGMSSLVLIDLSGNALLNGSIPSLVNSTNLVNLTLDNDNFDGFEEPFSINAPNLQYLSVAGNILEGSIPLAITELQSLTTISLSGNRLSGNILAAITKLPNISAIDLSSNKLSGNIPSGFSNLMSNPTGFSLDLSDNQLSGSIPVDFVQLESSYISVLINVSSNRLNGSIPAQSAGSRLNTYSAIYLDFSHNQLEGPALSQLSGFWYLNLNDNLLSGDIVDVLADSQAFQPTGYYLNLRNNLFTGDLTRLTSYWANWSKLNYVDLSNNNLSWRPTESIPDPVGAAMDNFPNQLLNFLVSGNNFSGTSLPVALSPADGSLLFLSELDLSDNQLEGVISGDVFNHTNLKALTSLNLSNNRITGAVSESIVVFSNQSSVDLSNNQLSGDLPFIASNSSLINIQYIQGNPKLCGSPLPYCGYPLPLPPQQTGIAWWIVLLIVGGSVIIAVGSCLVAAWRWRVSRKRHQQDADLIRTLMERESVTLMSLRDLTKATNGFAETARIGEGGFGTVYQGHLNDGATVAIKRSKHGGSENNKEQFLNEVKILSQVNHRHLVKLLGCCMENNVALLVFEFVSNGTLQEHLRGKVGDGPLSWKQRLTIALQTADALNYLHSAATFPIYHRDVKSANILLNDDLSAKVADFGLSKLLPVDASHISATALQGTVGYMDPEFWTSFQQTDKSDVYSFGVVLLELISAKPAVDYGRADEESSLVLFASPQIKIGDLQELIDPALKETYSDPDGHGRESILSVGRLAMKCLEMRSRARPSMNEVWKELHNLDLEFTGTAPEEHVRYADEEEERLGYTDEEENAQNAGSSDLALLSQDWSEDNWRFASHREAGSLELTLKSARVLKFKSKSMGTH